MMRPLALVTMVACSAGHVAVSPPPTDDASAIAQARQSYLEGRFADAVAQLEVRLARLDPAGLALLGRARLGAGRADDGRAALETAVARAGVGGSWRWTGTDATPFEEIAFARDGRAFVYGTSHEDIGVWDVVEHRQLARIANPNGVSISLSPDGKSFAQYREPGIVIRDATTGADLATSANFAPPSYTDDGHLLAYTKDYVPVELDAGGKELARYGRPRDWVHAVGRYAVVVLGGERDKDERDFVVWDRGARKKIATFALPGAPWFVAGAGDTILVGMMGDSELGKKPWNAVVYAIDATTNARRRLAVADATSAPHGAAVTPDGKRVVVSTNVGARVVDIASGRTLHELATGGGALAIHPSGAVALVSSGDGFALWNLDTGARVAQWNRPDRANAIAFDAAGDRLAIASSSGRLTSWNLATGALWTVMPASVPATRVAFADDGTLAAVSTFPYPHATREDELVSTWTRDGKRVWAEHVVTTNALAYVPGTTTLAVQQRIPGVTDDVGIQLWTPAGIRDRVLAPGAADAAWSKDGTLVYARDTKVVIDAPDGSTRELDVTASAMAAAPDGARVAVVESGGRLSIWDRRGEPTAVAIDENAPTALAWSPDGGLVATATDDKVRLRDPTTAAVLATLVGGTPPTALAFHPSGRYLAVAYADGTVGLWSVASGALIASLAVPDANRGIVFAPDGTVDGTLAPEDPLRWTVGDASLPGLGAWQRAKSPGFLAKRLAALPPDVRPRATPPAPPAPPPCFAPDPESGRGVVVSAGPATSVLPLCVVAGEGREVERLPACFTLDLATGVYRPRTATPREALLRRAVDPRRATAERAGAAISVCRAGACRSVAIAELAAMQAPELEVGEDGATLVAYESKWATGHQAVVYDVASGRRIAKLKLESLFEDVDEGVFDVTVLGPALQVSVTPCAGPCTQSILTTLAGKRIAWAGGAKSDEGIGVSGVHVAGDVWMFDDASTKLVHQDVRTGRVVRRVERPADCTGGAMGGIDGSCPIQLVKTELGTALLQTRQGAGDVTLVDTAGKTLGRYRMPVCR